MAELMNRKDMDKKYLWKLSDMISGSGEFEQLMNAAKEQTEAFAAFQGKVHEDPKKAIRTYFDTSRLIDQLYVYSSMYRDEDGMNNEAVTEFSRAQQLAIAFSTASAFLRPELLEMEEMQLKALLNDPDFSDYDVYVKEVLRAKPHSLPVEQETLMAQAGEIINGAGDAYGSLNNIDLPLPYVVSEEGGEEKLTHAGYGRLIKSRNRDVRKSAFCGMMNAYKAFGTTISNLYDASVKGDRFEAVARKHASCLEASLYPDEIPTEVYTNLISSVHAALPALNEYLSIRKNMLNVDELHLYDLYVPIISDVDMPMEYEDAFACVKEGLKPLGEDYQLLLEQAHDNGWVDVYENKNKRGGAYSWGIYGVHPYVLLNHTDDLSGMTTLAHELGHAMHSHYSNANQPFAKAGYSLFVAEVASTCNEVLMMRYLLNKYADDFRAKAYLCNQLLEEFRTTVFRQTMFAEFEKISHEMLENGEPLTCESLSKAYYHLNETYYGEVCSVDDEISSEWMRIPHFYNAFYVYKYATGFSAAVAIADRILREGEPAVKDYKKFLSAGGSVPPITALKYARVDMSKPEAVQNALKVFEDTVRMLKENLSEKNNQ